LRYLENIHLSLIEDFKQILKLETQGFSPFSKKKDILPNRPNELQKDIFYLYPQKIDFEEIGQGRTHQEDTDDTILMFRYPSLVQISYKLESGELTTSETYEYLESLSNYFFDRKKVQSIVPQELEKYPSLYNKLKSEKASFKLINLGPNQHCRGMVMDFVYMGPFHSGNPLRTEKLVTRRDVSISL
jgi:hypothetical protein